MPGLGFDCLRMTGAAFGSRRVQFVDQGIQVVSPASLLARTATYLCGIGARAPAQLGDLAATAFMRGQGIQSFKRIGDMA